MSNPYGPPGGYRPQGYGQPAYGRPQQPGWGQPQAYGQRPAGPPAPVPDPERNRRIVGLTLWILMMVVGAVLNIAFQFLEVFSAAKPGQMLAAVMQGALFAFVPLCVYLSIPAVLDRYDPEPWWCLAMAFLWGAVVATGFAGFINTFVHVGVSAMAGEPVGEIVTKVVSAPLCEEFFKGLAVLGTFYFLHREFDGMVNGVIYATFCALGFAAVENVSYYAHAAVHHQFGMTFFIRGILAPWGHPLYTSMTGLGFGLSRESSRGAVRWLAPIGGYFVGVTLHAIWNFVPTVLGETGFWLLIPLWLLFVMAFFGMVVALVIRKGRTIRSFLRDEVSSATSAWKRSSSSARRWAGSSARSRGAGRRGGRSSAPGPGWRSASGTRRGR